MNHCSGNSKSYVIESLDNTESALVLNLPKNGKQVLYIGKGKYTDFQVQGDGVSNVHALLLRKSDQWYIFDSRSTNGLFINGNKLLPDSIYKLISGDTLFLGKCTFKFSEIMPNYAQNDISDNYDSLPLPFKTKQIVTLNEKIFSLESQLMEMKDQLHSSKEDANLVSKEKLEQDMIIADLRYKYDALNKDLIFKEHLLKIEKKAWAVCIEQEKELACKDKVALLDELEEIKELLGKREESIRLLTTFNKEKESEVLQLIKGEAELKKSFERAVSDLKLSKMDVEKLNSEIISIHSKLEEVKMSNEQLSMENSSLDKYLLNLLFDKERLENDLKESVDMQKDSAQVEALKNMQDCVIEIMDNELNCSICSELFIDTLTLGCSHSFCSYCITSWKRNKKDCPICRKDIKTESKSPVIDNFICNMLEFLPDYIKKIRNSVMKERSFPFEFAATGQGQGQAQAEAPGSSQSQGWIVVGSRNTAAQNIAGTRIRQERVPSRFSSTGHGSWQNAHTQPSRRRQANQTPARVWRSQSRGGQRNIYSSFDVLENI